MVCVQSDLMQRTATSKFALFYAIIILKLLNAVACIVVCFEQNAA